MINIQFMTGRDRQAIYKGQCECGNVLTFTPGGSSVTCVQCGRRWVTDVVAVADKIPMPKTSAAKIGPKERKRKGIE